MVNNGLRAGWLSLGHGDGLGEMLPLLDPTQQKTIPKTSDVASEASPGVHDEAPVL